MNAKRAAAFIFLLIGAVALVSWLVMLWMIAPIFASFTTFVVAMACGLYLAGDK